MTDTSNLIEMEPIQSLNEMIEKSQHVILYFHTTWCQPCKQVEPTILQIAKEFPNVTIIKIDADSHPLICAAYKIQSVPTMIGIGERRFYLSAYGQIADLRKTLEKEWNLK